MWNISLETSSRRQQAAVPDLSQDPTLSPTTHHVSLRSPAPRPGPGPRRDLHSGLLGGWGEVRGRGGLTLDVKGIDRERDEMTTRRQDWGSVEHLVWRYSRLTWGSSAVVTSNLTHLTWSSQNIPPWETLCLFSWLAPLEVLPNIVQFRPPFNVLLSKLS